MISANKAHDLMLQSRKATSDKFKSILDDVEKQLDAAIEKRASTGGNIINVRNFCRFVDGDVKEEVIETLLLISRVQGYKILPGSIIAW